MKNRSFDIAVSKAKFDSVVQISKDTEDFLPISGGRETIKIRKIVAGHSNVGAASGGDPG